MRGTYQTIPCGFWRKLAHCLMESMLTIWYRRSWRLYCPSWVLASLSPPRRMYESLRCTPCVDLYTYTFLTESRSPFQLSSPLFASPLFLHRIHPLPGDAEYRSSGMDRSVGFPRIQCIIGSQDESIRRPMDQRHGYYRVSYGHWHGRNTSTATIPNSQH
jgi:hypothetical protein